MGWCHLLAPGQAFSIPTRIRSSFLTAGGWHGVAGRKMRWFRTGAVVRNKGTAQELGFVVLCDRQDECLWFASRLGGCGQLAADSLFLNRF